MTVSVRMDSTDVVKSLKNIVKNYSKELGIVVNKVGRKGKSLVAKEVTKELTVTQKVVKKQIDFRKVGKTGGELSLDKSPRIPLRDFKARQTRAGVSYRISKTKGRKVAKGAFQGPRPGRMNTRWKGRVFKRTGKSRLPITQLYGPSPWGVIKKNNKQKPIADQLRTEMRKQLAERLRYQRLKKSGAI